MNLAKCGIDILVGYFGLTKGGNLNISVKEIRKMGALFKLSAIDRYQIAR
ncbi:MAG: hypothetical protein GY777_01030 [Candidatus Brocadiaceae bacterium]|nr:hypothetical protein [Candidatus Brocadiaceae bacterium]